MGTMLQTHENDEVKRRKEEGSSTDQSDEGARATKLHLPSKGLNRRNISNRLKRFDRLTPSKRPKRRKLTQRNKDTNAYKRTKSSHTAQWATAFKRNGTFNGSKPTKDSLKGKEGKGN